MNVMGVTSHFLSLGTALQKETYAWYCKPGTHAVEITGPMGEPNTVSPINAVSLVK